MMLLEGREHLFSHDFGQDTPVGLWQLIAASSVFSLGYVLLGVAIFRAGVLPRAPIGIPAFLIVGHTLFGAGLAWLGYALWKGTEGTPMPRG